ncbi:hypothetical protein, partial [Escherichia coli]|uniref:hypothetical protein n=3 Tax=Escherichia coli TaxID=562 RepID=UPI00193CBBEC
MITTEASRRNALYDNRRGRIIKNGTSTSANRDLRKKVSGEWLPLWLSRYFSVTGDCCDLCPIRLSVNLNAPHEECVTA